MELGGQLKFLINFSASVRLIMWPLSDLAKFRELVSRMSSYIYKEVSSATEVGALLNNLKVQFSRIHGAFIYMCEHMGISGTLVWHSELTRVIGYMLEKESNVFLKHAVIFFL